MRRLRKLARLFAEEQEELAEPLRLRRARRFVSRRPRLRLGQLPAATMRRTVCGCWQPKCSRPVLLQIARPNAAAVRRTASDGASCLRCCRGSRHPSRPVASSCRQSPLECCAAETSLQRSSMCVAAGDAWPPRWFVRGTLSALLMEEGLVEATLHDECVPAVTVIGTESVGRALAAQTGWLLKRSSLHVVGNGATVVMPSADLNVALAAAIEALTSGTEAGKRLILHAEYLQRLCSPAGQGSRSFATWRPDEAGD